MTPHTNWLPGVLVLLGGLLIAVGWVLFARRKGHLAGASADETLANLEKRASDLIEQLRELQQDRHHLSDEQFAAEKSRLEKAAADALRARDAYQGTQAAPGAPRVQAPAAKAGFFAQHPQLAGALWGGGVVLFFVVLGLLLSESSQPRGDGGVMTGVTPPGMEANAGQAQGGAMNGTAPQQDPDLQAAIGEVRAHPENVQLADEVSHALIRAQDFETARELVNRSIGMDPFDAELRIHRAFLRATTGDVEGAKAELERLGDEYPKASEALLFLGMIALTDDHKPQALEYLERYAAEVPASDLPPHLADGILALRREVAKAPQQ